METEEEILERQVDLANPIKVKNAVKNSLQK
jgi:hypothetical protein